MVSIDEPVLGVIVGAKTTFGYNDEDIIEAYNVLRNACGDRVVGTHICGRISPKLADILLQTDLDFISHEFYDTPKNTAVYSPKKIEENNKTLSVGCLSTKNPNVESPEQILEVMKRFSDYGTNLIFTPDCGFKKLLIKNLEPEESYQISIKKLSNMVKAAKTFSSSK
jgi:methionine synthase II (cobalamin-independent)